MKNRILFSVVMISFVLLALIGGIMLIGDAGKMFESKSAGDAVSSFNSGSVTLIRRGAGYELKEGISLKTGDKVKTAASSSAGIKADSKMITLDENSALTVESCDGANLIIELAAGASFFDIPSGGTSAQLTLKCRDMTMTASDSALLSIEVFNGTQTINVYKGEVQISFNGETKDVSAGRQAVLLQNEDGKSSISYADIQPVWLSGFLIGKLTNEEGICFGGEQLKGILAARQADTEAAKQAQQAHEAKVLAQGGTVPVISVNNTPQETASEKNSEVYSCTVAIRCDTILNNMGALASGKSRYVPKDGVILDTSKVEFIQGETVYNVLKRVCAYDGIPLEYEWTVQYGGYYIEGINNLFEFDCGSGSGWMYKVNGWYPNYGSSNYILKDGDVIVWNYTCDLGKDLGAVVR